MDTRNSKRLHNELENQRATNGKTDYFDWAIFHSYVKLPEGNSSSNSKGIIYRCPSGDDDLVIDDWWPMYFMCAKMQCHQNHPYKIMVSIP